MSATRATLFTCDTCGKKAYAGDENYDLPHLWEYHNPANEPSWHECPYCRAQRAYDEMPEDDLEELKQLRDDMDGTSPDLDQIDGGYEKPSDFSSGPQDEWDQKMKEDYENGGPLKKMAEKARKEYKQDETEPLPGTEKPKEVLVIGTSSHSMARKIARAVHEMSEGNEEELEVMHQTPISDRTLEMIETGIENLKGGKASEPVDIKEDLPGLFNNE